MGLESGETATFTVAGEVGLGTAELTYQWYKSDSASNTSGTAIEGETTTELSFVVDTSMNGSYYYCVLNNGVLDTASDAVLLTVYHPPVVNTQPDGQAVREGETAQFLFDVSGGQGTTELTFQWYMDGIAIDGATSSSYDRVTSREDNGKSFHCIATNGKYSHTSDTVGLTVYYPPSIDTQPISTTVMDGETASFEIAASGGNGTLELTYQWYMNGTAIDGAADTIYNRVVDGATDNGTTIYCEVFNGQYTLTSSGALLEVYFAPVIDTQPTPQTLKENKDAIFSVEVSGGHGTQDLSYQWYMNDVAIDGATTNSYTRCATTAADNGTYFHCEITNGKYTVVSDKVLLTVMPYCVTWVNADGTIIEAKSDYHYGDPVIVPDDPTLESDRYAYKFKCWTPDIEEIVTEDMIYTATYTTVAAKDEFTVSFVDYDGTEIVATTYQQGEEIIFPDDPTRDAESGEGMVYTFDHWEMVVDADKNVTYTATYSMSCSDAYTNYVVIFEDHDGTELSSATYQQGDTVVIPAVPERPANETHYYVVTGWKFSGGNTVMPFNMSRSTGSNSVSYVAVYTANYMEVLREYTVTFRDANGKVISSNVYHYGDTIVIPDNPRRSGYAFVGWGASVSPICTGSVTYTASYYRYRIPSADKPTDDITIAGACNGGNDCPLSSFSDTPTNAWYHDGVHYCLATGLMAGTSNDTFSPEALSTRAAVVAILWLLEETPAVSSELAYFDVSDVMQEADAICWATSVGLINGYGNGAFGPDDIITREQAVTLLYRYAEYKGCDLTTSKMSNLSAYSDASEMSEWAFPAMEYACNAGIVHGTPDDKLSPLGNATRAQIATLFLHFCQLIRGA